MNIWHMITSGGFAMYPLLLCSLAVWVVIFERAWSFRRLTGEQMSMFRFTMRDVLWLMALVAVCASWFHQSMRWKNERQALVDQHDAALANERRLGELRAKEAAEQVFARYSTPRGIPVEQNRLNRSRLLDEELTPATPLSRR